MSATSASAAAKATDQPLTVAGAGAALAEAERQHADLIDRMSRDEVAGITPAMLRDSESAITFARSRVAAAQRAQDTRAAREAAAALPALAARLARADEAKLEKAWQRLRAALDDCARATAEHNGIITEVERALRPLLPHLPAGAAMIGGSAWIGGVQIGDTIAAKQGPPALGGQFIPVTPPPQPRPAPTGGCPNSPGGIHQLGDEWDRQWQRPTGRKVCFNCDRVFAVGELRPGVPGQ